MNEGNSDDRNAMWNSVLGFLSLELFGPDVVESVNKHIFKGYQKQKEEEIIDVELEEWEKRLFILTDAIMEFGNKNQDELPVYRAKAISRIADALREIFWANISLRHKEVRNKSFGVRGTGNGGLIVVEVPKSREENPLEGILKMVPFPPPGRR